MFFLLKKNFLFCIGVQLINNVIVSGEQQGDSAKHVLVSILPQTPSHPGCHITLSRVPSAMRQVFAGYAFIACVLWSGIPSGQLRYHLELSFPPSRLGWVFSALLLQNLPCCHLTICAALLGHITCYEHITVYFSILPRMDMWVVSSLGLFEVKLLRAFSSLSLGEHKHLLFLSRNWGMGLLCGRGCVCLELGDIARQFSKLAI